MAAYSIELKALACKGVQSLALFNKPTIYAVVYLTNDGDRPDLKRRRQQQQRKTTVDRAGGQNPEWDQPMRFDLDGVDRRDLFLRFDLMDRGGRLLLGDRVVGVVRIPVADLEAEKASGAVCHVSYQVRTPDGKRNGVLNLSYKVTWPETSAEMLPPDPALNAPGVSLYSPPCTVLDPVVSSPEVSPCAQPYSAPDLAVPSSGVRLYPPPPPPTELAVSSSGASVYPPPPSPPEPLIYLPPHPGAWSHTPASAVGPPPPGAGYFPGPDPAVCCLAEAPGYYPPLPQVNVSYYPPPPLACCYPAPPQSYGQQKDGWDRGLYGYC